MHMYDFAIIGGGILGLATARRLLQKKPGARLLLVEKENDLARHQSGHNSGVIHAGVYYAPGSLKARLSKAGAERTIRYCEEHGIPHERCGKLIVATDADEVERMSRLELRVKANGLDYTRIGADELRELEPNIAGIAALQVHATGIVDFARVCRELAADVRKAGGDIRTHAEVTGLQERAGEVVLQTGKGDFLAKMLISCAGLQGDRVARQIGLKPKFRVVPFRGEYYRVASSRGQLARHLIYPVPDPSLPFLGVHLTKHVGNYFTVGPNAMLSLGRETYDANRPVLADMASMAAFPGFWLLMMRFARAGLYEMQGSLFKSVYLERARKYCPSLEMDDLEPYRPGIRAQTVGRNGRLIDDFLFLETARSLHVCNAPSPAATSALPIGDEVAERALKKAG